MNIEEKKVLAEKLLGWKFDYECEYGVWFITPENHRKDLNNFNPHKGGSDLTEVLKALTLEQRNKMFGLLPDMDGEGWDIIGNWILWFQDNTNAPTICEAIHEVLTREVE